MSEAVEALRSSDLKHRRDPVPAAPFGYEDGYGGGDKKAGHTPEKRLANQVTESDRQRDNMMGEKWLLNASSPSAEVLTARAGLAGQATSTVSQARGRREVGIPNINIEEVNDIDLGFARWVSNATERVHCSTVGFESIHECLEIDTTIDREPQLQLQLRTSNFDLKGGGGHLP
ncbi:uncharacterized protein DFL_002797 [Arthrobotrys flagrans]|uniref:Uncharacterized protein n=1 Tax=Arthrobotrys flagrans TaxID=97331 RepID=A0A437ABI4_ARTFL|nr:hypothetical protein DFL_002797 [Arthrobotrys flagrans]